MLAEDQQERTATSSESWSAETPQVQQGSVQILPLPVKSLSSPGGSQPRPSQPKQTTEEQDVHQKQTGWCRYYGRSVSQPCNVWTAAESKDAAAEAWEQHLRQEQQQQARQEQLQKQQRQQQPRQHELQPAQQPHQHCPTALRHPVSNPSHHHGNQSQADRHRHSRQQAASGLYGGNASPQIDFATFAQAQQQCGPLAYDQLAQQELAELLGTSQASAHTTGTPLFDSPAAPWQQMLVPNHGNDGMAKQNPETDQSYSKDVLLTSIVSHHALPHNGLSSQEQQALRDYLSLTHGQQQTDSLHHSLDPAPQQPRLPAMYDVPSQFSPQPPTINTTWLQTSNAPDTDLDHLLSDSMHFLDPSIQSHSNLGMGQFAMEAASGGPWQQLLQVSQHRPSSVQHPTHQQHPAHAQHPTHPHHLNHPQHPTHVQQHPTALQQPPSSLQQHPCAQWQPDVQLQHLRVAQPSSLLQTDLALANQLPANHNAGLGLYPSVQDGYNKPHDYISGRSTSEDMTRYNSLGGSANTARTGSSGLGVPQQDELTQAMASPKSSLGSSLPSVPTSLKIAQGGQKGSTGVNSAALTVTQPTTPAQPIPTKLLIQLVSAPSMFRSPICTGKLLSPSFKVQVAMLSDVPTQLPLTLKAYVLTKDNLDVLERWHPSQHMVTEGLMGGEVQQTVSCSEAWRGTAEEASGLFGVADFVFSELKFTHSSRMKPRWLVIAATLPTQDVIYVLYNVPTIIMSRACDQFTKAAGILSNVERGLTSKKRPRTSSPLRPSPRAVHEPAGLRSAGLAASDNSYGADDAPDWPSTGRFSHQRWQQLVEMKYNSFNLVRPLDPEDLEMMEGVAGFHHSSRSRDPSGDLSAQEWAFFGAWYLSYLRIFRSHQQLWMMQSPTAICGFAIDRVKAEQLLSNQPWGTFVVRPGLTLAGCMVISAAVEGGIIKHMALDGNQLEQRSLEVWVRDVHEAQELLDYKTGLRYNKAKAFLLHCQRFGAVVSNRSKPNRQSSGSASGAELAQAQIPSPAR